MQGQWLNAFACFAINTILEQLWSLHSSETFLVWEVSKDTLSVLGGQVRTSLALLAAGLSKSANWSVKGAQCKWKWRLSVVRLQEKVD